MNDPEFCKALKYYVRILKDPLNFHKRMISCSVILPYAVTLIPGYPILIGVFFISFGVFSLFRLQEKLHHIPGFEVINSFGFENMTLQLVGLIFVAVLYVLLTFMALNKSIKRFEIIDL
mgnify:CR=1 FL=1